jgi:Domain of unknown function (DUF4440)
MHDSKNGSGLSIHMMPTDSRNFTTKMRGNEKPLDGRETIRVYFIPFMKRGDTVAFDHDDSVKVFGDTAVETGYYHFNIFPERKPDVWVARYTFVSEKKNGSWMSLDQHSSRIPNPETSEQLGTADEAKAMLIKAAAAIKADREIALAQFNKGEGGFRDLYPFCYRLIDGKTVAGPLAIAAGTDARLSKDPAGR